MSREMNRRAPQHTLLLFSGECLLQAWHCINVLCSVIGRKHGLPYTVKCLAMKAAVLEKSICKGDRMAGTSPSIDAVLQQLPAASMEF